MGTAPTGYQTPKTNWAAGNIPAAPDFNRIEGNILAVEEGSRTIDPAQAPTENSGSLRQLLDWFANRIKAITGKNNWYDAPDITLATLAQHKSRHATGGPDALTPADIGAAPSSHTHTKSQITDFAHKSTHATGGTDALTPADIGAAAASDLAAHLADNMPHRATDPSTGKVYRWGLTIQSGEWGIIYEEVV